MKDLVNDNLEVVGFQCIFYARYVDDSVLCVDASKRDVLLNAFSGIHPRLKFTLEIEKDRKLIF